MKFFATAAKGTEPALRDELRELRLGGVRADRGGVHVEGDVRDGFRICLHSRIASRVLSPVATFEAASERAFYDGVRSVDLDAVLTPRQTMVVSAACRSSRMTHTEYLSQLTKDAIVDRIRDRVGSRPSVDKRDADVRFFVHLVKDVATLYLDLSGEPLHKRGFRIGAAEAPLRETLAAAVLRFSGWDRKRPLADPLCGSGTLLVEAALWARNVAPGLARQRFGFERWASFDESARRTLQELRDEARAAVLKEGPPIFGSDASLEAIDLSRSAASRAGVTLDLRVAPLASLDNPSLAVIVANPPYGRRVTRPADLARDLGRMIDRHADATVTLLVAEDQQIGRTRRRPESPRPVFNGDIPCLVRTWRPRLTEMPDDNEPIERSRATRR
jgi:putative N6-adenine-specific DNA methylase